MNDVYVILKWKDPSQNYGVTIPHDLKMNYVPRRGDIIWIRTQSDLVNVANGSMEPDTHGLRLRIEEIVFTVLDFEKRQAASASSRYYNDGAVWALVSRVQPDEIPLF